MTKTCSGAFLAIALLGCSSEGPPCASVGNYFTFDSALARLQNVSLIRAGDGFTLAGYDIDSGSVRWGRLALDGTLTQETSFPMAQPLVGPVFAATQKTSPGDQLIAIAIVDSATVAGGFDLTATVHTVGAPDPAPPIVLNSSDSIPVGADTGTMQLAAGAAASGNVGYVAWGTRVSGKSVYYLLLPADAITLAAPSKVFDDSVPANVPNWDCVAPSSRSTGLSFSMVTPSADTSNFVTLEIDEAGDTILMTYRLTVAVVSCRIVGSPRPNGSYFMALHGIEGGSSAIDFATYYPPTDPKDDGTVKTEHPVLPAAVFGDPQSMPRPAWVTSAGSDVVFGLAHRGGPEVVRYTYNAVPHGATLPLRSANGQTGPVAAWVGDDTVYVTYADQVNSGGSTTTKRYFMRVDSPASLP
jgi:hypothetical protein